MAKAAKAEEQSDPRLGQSAAPRPSVGRIVHFGVERILANAPGDADLVEGHAAIITRVDSPNPDADLEETMVTLTIFHPDGHHNIQRVGYSEELAVGRWSWPARV